MNTISKFEDIVAWQRMRKLLSDLYSISSKENFSKDFALKSQLLRAGISVMANIAEGYGRKSKKEFANYLNIAHGSIAEVQALLYVAKDQKYIENESFTNYYYECTDISKMILGFQNYLRKSNN